jgi:two-component system, chemotaxis family, sensor kinase CheA
MDDLRDEFIAETRETLETLAGELIIWEKNPGDQALIDGVFRFFHTVKGSCGFLDLPRLERLSHAAEDLLSVARDGRLTISGALVSAVLAAIDRISELTDALETGVPVHDNDAALIEAMLQFHPDHLVRELGIPLALSADESADTGVGPWDQGLGKSRTVRVSLNQLDKLMNGVSDLVLARNELSRQLRLSGMTNELDQAFARLSGTVAEIRDAISVVRMQPIDRLFSGIPRLLRDLGVELGKEIEFSIEGGDVEIDREMVESLRDPLTHIIRNAADHGIELPAERIALGKPAIGQIRVNARQAGNQIVLDISDDGRGINMDRLRQTAISRKLLNIQQWQALTDEARLATIFEPGLSTAEKITAISGRGVGMDVVRTNLQAVGATINLENAEGRGLSISLLLPLTLSIIAGISVRAGGQTFALTRSSVVEILSASNVNVVIEDIGGAKMAKVRGARLILARLEDVLGLEERSCAWNTRTLIIIRPANGAVYALDVEAVIDSEELVIKPCAPLIMATGLYAGTTLPDNGKPMLLLDASGVAAAIGSFTVPIPAVTIEERSEDEQAAYAEDTLSVLLFETCQGMQRALPLSIVERMEDINADQIFEVAGRTVVQVGGKSFELFGIAQGTQSDLIKVLRLSDGQATKYLAIDDVMDIFTVVPDRSLASASSPFDGIVHINGVPIELMSPYSIFGEKNGHNDAATHRPLCFVQSDGDDFWQRNILMPLLMAAGYTVSFDESDRDGAAVILQSDDASHSESDPRTIILRDNVASMASTNAASIYRYDRPTLLLEIEARIAGRA